jgi:predicted acylesterase/phospholipase RssA
MKWLAVCSNGAVALGAFEAGVLSQIYADVVQINALSGAPVLGIDAIAGASAGAVTGTILAQAIATKATPADLTKRLQDTWVAGLGLDALIGNTKNSANSVFDPQTLVALAPTVTKSDEEMKREGIDGNPVTMSIALTNLDGIPRVIQIADAPVVVSTFVDYETIAIEKGMPGSLSPVETLRDGELVTTPMAWKDVVQLAITSASFPFAFKSQILKRDLLDFPGSLRPADGSTTAKFNYTDGGVLNNNPLGRAIDAVSYQEKRHPAMYATKPRKFVDRLFVVIDPDPTTPEKAASDLTQLQNNLDVNGVLPQVLAAKLIGVYFNTALYQDLLAAEATNQLIEKLEVLEATGVINAPALDQVLGAVGAGFKKKIDIDRVSPLKLPLAGAFVGHFGGFFLQSYREYDFAAGCKAARSWIRSLPEAADLPLDSDLQAAPTEFPVPGGFKGVRSDELSTSKSKIADRIKAILEHDLKLKGILGFFEPGILDAVRALVRKELDNLMD